MKIAHSKSSSTADPKRESPRLIRAARRVADETLRAPAWRLPGGVGLAEYALRGGLVASRLMTWGGRSR